MEEREERKQEEMTPVIADGDHEHYEGTGRLGIQNFIQLALALSHTLA